MQAGTHGVTIPVRTGVDLTGVTDILLELWAPSDSPETEPPTLSRPLPPTAIAPPPTAGMLNYTVADGDFPAGGLYFVRFTDTSAGVRRTLAESELYIESAARAG